MILESIVTTTNVDGTLNVSPMGPTLPAATNWDSFELRPFDSSTTFANLDRTGQGVMHVHDDVLLFARAAIGKLEAVPKTFEATAVVGNVLTGACRAYEFEVVHKDTTGPRMHLNCVVRKAHRLRDFFGFNRAKHAVLEAAILATRIDFLPEEHLVEQFSWLASAVEKTGGQDETDAFSLLREFVDQQLREKRSV